MPTVANSHCELVLSEDELQLTDLGSPAGTLRNGRRVEQAVLAHSDRLTVGTITFEVRVTREASGQTEPKDLAAPRPAPSD